MSLKSLLEYLLSDLEVALLLEDSRHYDKGYEVTRLLGKLLEKLDNYQLVPKEPTAEMLKAAFQDGIVVNGRPIWKYDIDFRNKWKYQQMLENAPEIKL